MDYYRESWENALQDLNSNGTTGLSWQEADERLSQYGQNILQEGKGRGLAARFLEQFKDVMILILLAAAAVSFGIAIYEGNPREFFEPALILLIVVLNAIMGVVQESKAEKALAALKNMSAPSARVIRGGQEQSIDASQLVPGDLIHLEAGDFVPADARLVTSSSLKSEESALTGESVPSEKDANLQVEENAPIGDRTTMVFSGCSITYGTATAVVTATGMNTEMGRIADLLNGETGTQTPLQKKLSQLGKFLGIIALVACGVIFVVGLYNGLPVMEIFMTAVSLAVSAIPEGLPAIVTVVLSIGVQRMVRRNAIIRRLPAVETLGSASVICSDKTGTLTQNRMTLVKVWLASKNLTEDIGESGGNSAEVCQLLEEATLCCDATVTFNSDGSQQHLGDPTETAIIVAAYKNGMEKAALNEDFPRLATLPFDSDRKLMTTVNMIPDPDTGKKRPVVIVKGAFDVLASRCVAGDVETARKVNQDLSAQALRILAVAYKVLDSEPTPEQIAPEFLEQELTLAGLVGMIDPPRPEAAAAVAVCRKAGIKPVMITGDHVVTASAIARQLGILTDKDRAITGAQLDAMSDQDLDQQIEQIAVYARVSPENKIRIVRSWQRRGRVVSMTGDGVNDAPALKAADIGCAMGITGTDVAKGAADMTLTDDNFATIVDAVREGRGIYDNIKKVVGFLLGTNIGEVVCVFIAMLLWHKSPLLSMQLLWINLVTDSFPAVALGMEPVENDIMDRKPKPKDESIFANGYGLRIFLQGIMFGVLSLVAFRIGEIATGTLAGGQTLTFMVLSLSQTIQSFNMRSEKSLFKTGFFTNPQLNKAVGLSLGLVIIVIFTPVSVAFGLVTLPVRLYLVGVAMALIPLVIMEVSKAVGLVKKV